MMTILMGRAKSGKTEWMLRRIAALGDHSRQVLLVPEHATYAAEMDLCRTCGDTASRHAEVLSFRRLGTRVLSVTGGLADVSLDQGGKLLTLQKALGEVAPELKLYRRPSRKAAFLTGMLDLFDEFQSFAVSPEDLSRRGEELTGATGEKLRDLSLLYGAYQARLQRPGLDARDRMSKLCDHLEESRIAEGVDFFLDGFSYFTAQEQKVLSVLLRQGRSVTVSLLGEKQGGRSELFDVSYRTRDALLRLAEEAGCEAKTLDFNPRGGEGSPLRRLEQGFLGAAQPWKGETEAIRLLEAPDPYAEVEECAAAIRKLAAEGKCRYRDIGVGARNMGDYEFLLESVFERYGIPVYQSRRSDILETPALALVTGAMETLSSGFEAEDLFRCLKTGLAGLTAEECDRLENYALTWDIHGSLWLREEDWAAHPAGYGREWSDADRQELAEINALRQRVRQPFLLLRDGMKAAETAAGKVEALYRFLESVKLQQSLEEQRTRLAEAGLLQRAEECAQLWEILCEALDQFVELLGEEPITTDEFQRLLRQVLTQYSVGTIPAALDQVTVGDISRNDRHTCRYFFLLGANDHVLPAPAAAGGILNESDRDELASVGLRLAPRGMEQMSLELQNLYAALCQPTEGLFLSYPASDGAGTALRPAFVVERLRRLFPDVLLRRSDPSRPYRLTAEIPALEAAGRSENAALRAYFRQKRPEAMAAMDRAAEMDRGRLDRSAVRALYGDSFRFSASRIERMNTCHFAYFMEYGLQARVREKAQFNAPQIGTFLHYILENVVRDVKKLGGFAQVDDDTLRTLTEQYIARYAESELRNFQDRSPRFRYLFDRLRHAAFAVVRETAEELRHSDFVPVAFELDFGDGKTLPAVSIREPDSELRIGGKVDRVDGWVKNGKLYLRVVDYKTGRKEFRLSDVRMGLDIQMLLYLFTLQAEGERHFGMPVEPAGVLYFPARDEILSAERNISPELLAAKRAGELHRCGLLLRDPEVLRAMEHEALERPVYLPMNVDKAGDLSGSLASARQLGQLRRYVDRLLHRITREIRDGNIDADPVFQTPSQGACRYCQWAGACHFEDGHGRDRRHYREKMDEKEFWDTLESEEGGEDHG